MRELKSGTQLASRYTLVARLGAGGGRETWLATDRMTRARVALKISVDASSSRELLRREWQLCIRLVHAHIVRVFEFHDDPEGAFYSLQFVDGPDISALSSAPPEIVLAPIALIADALAYAHGKSVVHRDVKASNILLDANGAPYLIDFGVASTRAQSVGGGSLIAASPQQLAGEAPHPADDVFALGGLMFELLSGSSPYSSTETADDIRNTVPPIVTARNGSRIATPIRTLIADMLDKDAARRPDAAGVARAIEAAGIQPGPAPTNLVGAGKGAHDEVIRSDTAIHRPARTAATGTDEVDARRTGVSPKAAASGLAVLVLLLIGVVFLLPRAVNGPALPAPAANVEEPAEPSVDEPPAEEQAGLPERDERVQQRQAAEEVLGRLLAKTRTLEGRAVQRWGGLQWRRAEDAYKAGDEAYLERDYQRAAQNYAEAIEHVEPLLTQVDAVFERTLEDAEDALENADSAEAVRLYELAVAITPSHAPSLAGLDRARNLDRVLALTEQGIALERDLELAAAEESFSQAVEIDPQWEAAQSGLERVRATINQMQFDARMSEGLNALVEGDYATARAAFRVAKELQPGSPEPADGLLQVDQGIRLGQIASLETAATAAERAERWQAAADTYEKILELDANLAFAIDGYERANAMTSLYAKLDEYIADPDSLSAPRTMQTATQLVVDITRMPDIGPQLETRRDTLSKLLKRAATPLTVQLVSDNMTDVAIYKVGKLGTFATTELSLRPGTYVAVGSRPGYRDVRLEFRVAPEIDMQPVVVRCEEKI